MKKQARRRWGSLSREAVVDGALQIVDTEGLEALSMPRLARHLGTGVMTLYGHVTNKADLIDAMAERVLADLNTVEGRPDEWDRALAEHMRRLRQVVLRHPSLGAVLAARGLATPSVLRDLEAGLGLLRSAGFNPRTAVHIYYALLTYTLGFLTWEIPRVHRQPEATYREQWQTALTGLPAAEYPALHELADELPDAASENQFEAGLRALLRGFAPHDSTN
ncbi:TetR/AcrR family transcriptional regulator C-terminal domain-containing protein [Mycobacterium sp. pR1184]|uniref:TetR/AcrR family transcriptional regulator C-terminal domain-containing protein n=1 Tax=Mycobacterium sp. pR1184 TaxID=3238981 RepID=UPI00351B09BA